MRCYTLRELAEVLGAEIQGDATLGITSVATL
ncbi:MAG: UDP-3-O-[3-hydroxymyristoyl] glucosamine N-acyltransferase, partial [Shewanella sp.]